MTNSGVEAQLHYALSNADQAGAEYNELLAELRGLVGRGGKRLRPKLYLIAYQGYEGKSANVAEVAASIELVHAFLLIHDDIIDRSTERWGGPNITGVYYKKYSETMIESEATHAARSQALLAGDLCLLLAQEQVANSEFPPAIILQMQRCLNDCIKTTVAGELADVAQSHAAVVPTESEIRAMYRTKTAQYSFALPLTLAAMCTGNEADIPQLQIIANNLGVAYQLQNDLKGTSEDTREGKRTLLWLKTQELGAPAAKEYTQQLAATHIAEAIKLVSKLSMPKPGKAKLVDFMQALSNL